MHGMGSNSSPLRTHVWNAAERVIEGIELLHMMRVGQVKRLEGGDAAGRAKFTQRLFGAAL